MSEFYIFAPQQQQIEGLKHTLSMFSLEQFKLSVNRLCRDGMLSKNQCNKMIHRAEKITKGEL